MIKVYLNEKKDYVCELWGASTKHPDSVFYYSDFKKNMIICDQCQVFQWLLEIASRLNFPSYAKEVTDYAIEHWYNWDLKW